MFRIKDLWYKNIFGRIFLSRNGSIWHQSNAIFEVSETIFPSFFAEKSKIVNFQGIVRCISYLFCKFCKILQSDSFKNNTYDFSFIIYNCQVIFFWKAINLNIFLFRCAWVYIQIQLPMYLSTVLLSHPFDTFDYF